MDTTKRFFNNFWVKKYQLKEIFFKGKIDQKLEFYLKNQKNIQYDLIKKNFLLRFDSKYPLAYVLKKKGKIVGFLGTLISKRLVHNKFYLFCNIHSWLVDTEHRIASQLLFKKIINKCVITVLSSRIGLTKTFQKMGFKVINMKYRVIFLLNPLFFFKRKNVVAVYKKKFSITNMLNSSNLKIYNDHSQARYIKIIFYNLNKKTEKSFVIGEILTKKKIFKVFNFVYIENDRFVRNNWISIQTKILKEFKVLFCGQYFISDYKTVIPEISVFSKDIKKEIYIKNMPAGYKFNTLYSEFE